MLIVNDIRGNIASVHLCTFVGRSLPYADCTAQILDAVTEKVDLIPDDKLLVYCTVKNLFDLFRALHVWEHADAKNTFIYDMFNIIHSYVSLPMHLNDEPIDGDIVKIRIKKYCDFPSEKWMIHFADSTQIVSILSASNNGSYHVIDCAGRKMWITRENIICKMRDRSMREGTFYIANRKNK
jgi:hypothetical protein